MSAYGYDSWVQPSIKWSVARYGLSTGALAAIVAVYFLWLHANDLTVALTMLIVVLLVSANWGLRHAVYLSFASSAAFNFFFLPPALTFTIRDNRNWVALGTFLLTGIVASQLAERARSEASISQRRQREAERLYEFSQQMMVKGNVIDLLNDMLPVEVIHPLPAREAAQQIGLVLRPGEDVAIVEIVWHGGIIG